ncbi:MAG: NADH-quinone oxidoreductase subunit E [Spirochaetes bacterium]|jgi:NADH:ubiquinone oxidoreductase subunit E|nr:NADH-quinone oxidoreductase subunit E [Spirochaetota bacterium]
MSARDVVTRFAPERENILLMFHALQEMNIDGSYLRAEDVATVADYLKLSVAEVDGVLSFYHAFSRRRRGRHVVRLCDSLSCRICGSLELYRALQDAEKNGHFTIETVNCLGCCDTAPNFMIDDSLYRGAVPSEVPEILAAADEAQATEAQS